jgi:hypothetical protein
VTPDLALRLCCSEVTSSCSLITPNATGCRRSLTGSDTCFPYVCGQAAYNRQLRRAAPLTAGILHALAVACPSWCDQWRLLDTTPLPCSQRPGEGQDSELAGYGHDASHHPLLLGP